MLSTLSQEQRNKMSYMGQLSRGAKWFNLNKDVEGNLKQHITDDADKMVDVNLYLKQTEGKDRKKVDNMIMELTALGHAPNGKKSKRYAELKKYLTDLQLTKSKGKK